jgi:hypothetical protein
MCGESKGGGYGSGGEAQGVRRGLNSPGTVLGVRATRGVRAQDGLGRRRRSPGWKRLEVRDDCWAPAVGDRGGGGERLWRAGGGIGPKGQLGRGGCCVSWVGTASWARAKKTTRRTRGVGLI